MDDKGGCCRRGACCQNVRRSPSRSPVRPGTPHRVRSCQKDVCMKEQSGPRILDLRPIRRSRSRRDTAIIPGRCPAREFEDAVLGTSRSQSKLPGDEVSDEDTDAIDNILNELDPNATLVDFVTTVSPYTRDKGRVMRRVMGDEFHTFRKFVKNVFENHLEDVGDLLAHEQTTLKEKYEQWAKTIRSRARRVRKLVEQIVPNFDWKAYEENRLKYVKKLFKVEVSSKEDEEFDEWRLQNFLKILYEEEEVKKLQLENDELAGVLQDLRQDKLAQRSLQEKKEQTIQQKNTMLKLKVKSLHEKRNQLVEVMKQLFLKYEDIRANM